MAASVAGASTDTELAAELVQLLCPRSTPAGLAQCFAHPLLGDANGREPSLDDVAEAAFFGEPLADAFESFFGCHENEIEGIGFSTSQLTEGVPEMFSWSKSGGSVSSVKLCAAPSG